MKLQYKNFEVKINFKKLEGLPKEVKIFYKQLMHVLRFKGLEDNQSLAEFLIIKNLEILDFKNVLSKSDDISITLAGMYSGQSLLDIVFEKYPLIISKYRFKSDIRKKYSRVNDFDFFYYDLAIAKSKDMEPERFSLNFLNSNLAKVILILIIRYSLQQN